MELSINPEQLNQARPSQNYCTPLPPHLWLAPGLNLIQLRYLGNLEVSKTF